MTTNFLDNKIALSKFCRRGVSHEKHRFGRFSCLSSRPPLKKRKLNFYCRLAVSESFGRFGQEVAKRVRNELLKPLGHRGPKGLKRSRTRLKMVENYPKHLSRPFSALTSFFNFQRLLKKKTLQKDLIKQA